MTHSVLLKEVWGPNRDDSRALRVYIGTLRRKLEAEPSRPKFIVTEPNIGYRLVVEPDDVKPADGQPANGKPAHGKSAARDR